MHVHMCATSLRTGTQAGRKFAFKAKFKALTQPCNVSDEHAHMHHDNRACMHRTCSSLQHCMHMLSDLRLRAKGTSPRVHD